MAQIITEEGRTLDYINGRILQDGIPSKDWEPIFIKNGDNNTFYGFHNRVLDISYDLNGNRLRIDNEDIIPL